MQKSKPFQVVDLLGRGVKLTYTQVIRVFFLECFDLILDIEQTGFILTGESRRDGFVQPIGVDGSGEIEESGDARDQGTED